MFNSRNTRSNADVRCRPRPRLSPFTWVIVLAIVLTPTLYAFAASYQVAPGDSLWLIAKRFGVSVGLLKSQNGLIDDVIYPDQTLEVPDAQGPDYTPLVAQIKQYISTKGATYGIYFKDLISGETFGINETEQFTAASITKVPLVLYVNQLVAEGKLDWQNKLAYNSKMDYDGGAGILQFSAHDGDKYSLRILSNLAITISDNIAANMLRRYVGLDNLAVFMRLIGGETVYPGGKNITTARDMAAYMQAVLNFYAQNKELGRRLLDDMANPIYHVGLPGKLPDNITVAHKEGDVWGVANDFGVVYGSRPFILVVLSKNVQDLDQGFANIADISKIVYDYQEALAHGTARN